MTAHTDQNVLRVVSAKGQKYITLLRMRITSANEPGSPQAMPSPQSACLTSRVARVGGLCLAVVPCQCLARLFHKVSTKVKAPKLYVKRYTYRIRVSCEIFPLLLAYQCGYAECTCTSVHTYVGLLVVYSCMFLI